MILDPGPFDLDPGPFDLDPGMIMPSLVQLVKVDHPYHANFQCKLDPVPIICEDSQVAPHSVSGDSPQRVAVCYTVQAFECYVLSNLI